MSHQKDVTPDEPLPKPPNGGCTGFQERPSTERQYNMVADRAQTIEPSPFTDT